MKTSRTPLYGLVAALALALLASLAPAPALADAGDTVRYDSIRPGQPWLDDRGRTVQAHGGQVVTTKDAAGKPLYHWYGEDRSNGYYDCPGVHVYSSRDLYNWRDEGLALRSMDSPDQFTSDPYFAGLYDTYSAAQKEAVYRDLGTKRVGTTVNPAILERPKAVHNARTGKWVMWVHADGPSATPPEQAVKGVDFTRPYIGAHREAPALFKRDGTYYLLASGATGWDPNPARYATATSILGTWTDHGNPISGEGAEDTFRSQSTAVLPVDPARGRYLFMADRWTPDSLGTSPYVWLPVRFGEGDSLSLTWRDAWTLDDLDPQPRYTVTARMPDHVAPGDPRLAAHPAHPRQETRRPAQLRPRTAARRGSEDPRHLGIRQ